MINVDGLNFTEENGQIGALIITGENLQSEINYIIENKILSIYLSKFLSKKIDNIEFLKDISFIEKININDLSVNYSPIIELNGLKKAILSINNKEQKIDFSHFKLLESLTCDWFDDFPNFNKNDRLKELNIWKFNPRSKSLGSLKLPKVIQKFHLSQTNIEDLNGLESISLEEFECYYCRNLKSLKGLSNFAENIKTIIIENARNLTDYTALKSCSKLSKLILTNCGDIENINWISDLKNLKHFTFFGTNIIDGDLRSCLSVDYVSFNNKKHYNYKESDFSNR